MSLPPLEETQQQYINSFNRYKTNTERNNQILKTHILKQIFNNHDVGIIARKDDNFRDINKLYIETFTKINSKKKYTSSELYTSNSWLYCIGNQQTIWIFGCKQLQELLRPSGMECKFKDVIFGFDFGEYEDCFDNCENWLECKITKDKKYELKTSVVSKGYMMPIEDADKYCLKKYEFESK